MEATLRAQIVREIEAALSGGPVVVVATAVSAGAPPRAIVGEKVLVRRDGSSAGTLGDALLDTAVIEAAHAMFTANPRVEMQRSCCRCSRRRRAS